MLFNSLDFLIFFPIVTVLYFLLQHRFRWFLLLSASCYFYMAFVPIYILILAFTIVIDYFAGIFIEKSNGIKKKIFLIASLVANIGVLAIFKYYNFCIDNLSVVFNFIGQNNPLPYLSILLPIGLSFHTFQAMSYTFEVYRGNQKAERHFGIYSLYVMFYPQLVAGPIERPQNILHQFYEKHSFSYDNVSTGVKLMLWGFFKKVVIADRLAITANEIFNNPTEYTGIFLIIGALFFTFQIFCDFSGYSDIAIGAARVMGFRLMTNFDRPYSATSISEFWKKWHISLSSWFKDYLYIPLGGNRVPVNRMYFNLFFVFLLSGLWHGANWTFITWGALHGFYLVFALYTQTLRNKLSNSIGLTKINWMNVFANKIITFSLVCFAWIFFRANSINDAWYITTHLFQGLGPQIKDLAWLIKSILLGKIHYIDHLIVFGGKDLMLFKEVIILLLSIGILELVHYHSKDTPLLNTLTPNKPILKYVFYYLLLFAIILFGIYNQSQFIYFQF